MKKWKTKLTEAKNLRKKSAGLVYDRVKLLVAVYLDPEFFDDEGLDELSAATVLDEELSDVCAGFLELKAVLEFYPQRKQWEGRRLDLIVAEVQEAERKLHEQTKTTRTVHRVTKAMYAELQAERDRLSDRLQEVRDENAELHEEIGLLKHRITELEALLTPEGATA